MTAILPHIKPDDADKNTFAFAPRRSNTQEEGEGEEEEGGESTNLDNACFMGMRTST